MGEKNELKNEQVVNSPIPDCFFEQDSPVECLTFGSQRCHVYDGCGRPDKKEK